ncbi:hypothetical protein KKF34_00875 [Myxococcota bacterium]|nr:hypothetical protein [Myxococcota bacterium]MBU1495414.1 hypothetical protein [Myxococcota bacterium]
MVSFVFTTLFLMQSQNLNCRLGDNAPLPAQPNCGIPQRLRLEIPQTGKRMEFRRTDNPSLNGYFMRKRDATGPVKRFSNMINLYKVDLYLCPDDFKTQKTLLFHLLGNGKHQKMQCNLVAGGAAVSNSMPVEPAMKTVTVMPADMASPPVNPPPATVDVKKDTLVTGVIKPPDFKPAKKDPFARFLGYLALGAAGFLALVVIGAAFFISRRMKKLQ